MTVRLVTRLTGIGRRGELLAVTLNEAGALLSGMFARLVMPEHEPESDGVQEVSTDGPRPKGTRTAKPSGSTRASNGGGAAAGDLDNQADTKPGESHLAG